jgi:hypothetical protein
MNRHANSVWCLVKVYGKNWAGNSLKHEQPQLLQLL